MKKFFCFHYAVCPTKGLLKDKALGKKEILYLQTSNSSDVFLLFLKYDNFKA